VHFSIYYKSYLGLVVKKNLPNDKKQVTTVYLIAEELLNHVVGELVNFFVFVLLQLLDLGQAVDLLDVHARLLQLAHLLGHQQNVAQAVEQHLDQLGIPGAHEVADGLDDLTLHQVQHLFGARARRVVGDGPRGLLLHAQLTCGEDVDEEGHEL